VVFPNDWQIVDRDSARLGLTNEIAVGVAGANHQTICKFDRAESQKYKPVWIAIKNLAEDALQHHSLLSEAQGGSKVETPSEGRKRWSSQRSVATSEKTYRVRGIPSDYNRKRTRELLEAILKDDGTIVGVDVASLAKHPSRQTKVATVTFKQTPARLSPSKDEWTFKVPEPESHQPADGDEELDAIAKFSQITVDSHFKGITPLTSFNNSSDHKLESVFNPPSLVATQLIRSAALRYLDSEVTPLDLSKSEGDHTCGSAILSLLTFPVFASCFTGTKRSCTVVNHFKTSRLLPPHFDWILRP
jgi:hypothetical protein